jgi:hypothetical protein
MTADTLTDALLEEAEAIVWTESMRLLYPTAPSEAQLAAACAEAPAARPRPEPVVILAAMRGRPSASPTDGGEQPGRADHGPSSRVWPTQRSPPQAAQRVCSEMPTKGGDA